MNTIDATAIDTTFSIEAVYSLRENYGAHDWDGTGTCPAYWKNKGTITEGLVCGLSANEVAAWLQSDDAMECALGLQVNDDYYQQFFIEFAVIEFSRYTFEQVRDFCINNNVIEANYFWVSEMTYELGLSESVIDWALTILFPEYKKVA